MTVFCNLPYEQRRDLRVAIERAGGYCAGYCREAIRIAIPNPPGDFYNFMADIKALAEVPGSLHYFPLGTDNPPMSLRHDGNYPGSRGFWCYVNYIPTQES